MPQPLPVKTLHETETEVAILQVQYTNLSEKVEEVKTGLKDLQSHMDEKFDSITKSITDFRTGNETQHKEVNKRITDLEKWRWTLTGGAAAAGALGFQVIAKIFGFS